MLVVFLPIFVVDTKIIFRYDFVAPLTSLGTESYSGPYETCMMEIFMKHV